MPVQNLEGGHFCYRDLKMMKFDLAESMFQILHSQKTANMRCPCLCGVCGEGCSCNGMCLAECDGCDVDTDKHDSHYSDDGGECMYCMDMKTAQTIANLLKLSEEQESAGLSEEATESLNVIEHLLADASDENEIHMLPLVKFKEPMEIEDLEKLETEEMEDPAQVRWWLSEPPVSSTDIDEALKPSEPGLSLQPTRHVEMLPPSQEMTLEGETGDWDPDEWVEHLVSPKLDAPKGPEKNWEQEYQKEMLERGMDWGHDFQTGGYELPPELKEKQFEKFKSDPQKDKQTIVEKKNPDEGMADDLDKMFDALPEDDDVMFETSESPERLTQEDVDDWEDELEDFDPGEVMGELA